MRYMMLLMFVIIFGFLFYLFVAGRFSILSPANPVSDLKNIDIKVDNMQNQVGKYNSGVQDVEKQTNDALKNTSLN